MSNNNLQIAITAALRAAEAILDIYNDPNSDFGIERKADNSPLTLADRKAHELICEVLSPTGVYILSEEGRIDSYDQVRGALSSLWVVDPLDGTKEFIKRNGEFTVNIALVENGTPVMGVIYLPVKRILYFAQADLGSFRLEDVSIDSSLESIDQYITASNRLPIYSSKEAYTIVASRSHLSEQTTEFIEAMKKKHPKVECISSGSSIKIALVAEGSADVYPRFAPTMEWDTAAGDAIARYAGAEIVRHNDEKPLEYNKRELLNPWFIVRRKA